MPIETNIKIVALAKGLAVSEVTVMILDRPRHEDVVARVRKMGARVHLLTDGDVAGAITAARRGTGVDLLYGIGGTPEGVVAAAALKCLGGTIQGRLYPRNDEERAAAIEAGYDLDRVLTTEDLVKGENVFFAATGITDGALLRGVRFSTDGATTESIVMRATLGHHPRDPRRTPSRQAQADLWGGRLTGRSRNATRRYRARSLEADDERMPKGETATGTCADLLH